MNEQDVYIRLTPVFHRVFNRNDIALHPDLHSGNVPRWDSFANFELMMAVEDEFDIQFGVDEIASFKKVNDLVSAILIRQARPAMEHN